MKKAALLIPAFLLFVCLLGLNADALAEEAPKAVSPAVSSSDLIYYGVYKGEPVLWRVLDAEETNMGTKGVFLLSDGLIDKEQVPFDESSTLWEGSLAQQWCTNFLNQAFNEDEQALIPATSKDEDEVYLYALSWRAVSLKEEKVFFLSVIELEKYFGSYSEINKNTVEKSSLESYWWLRSPHRFHDDYHGIVLQGSYIHDYLPYACWSARPCINLLLQDAVMLLPADDDGQLGEVVIPDAEGQREWKLLIPKPDHPFRVDRVTEENRNLRIEYSGADMGVSALLSLIAADEQGNTKRYIRLEHPSVSSGTLNLSREQWGLTEEDRLFLVCENAPGPYLTGLASTPTELIAEEPEIAVEISEPTVSPDTAEPVSLMEPTSENDYSRQYIILVCLAAVVAALLLMIVIRRKKQH